MLTDDIKFLIAATALQLPLAGVFLALLHRHLTAGSFICLFLLLAAEFVGYREVRRAKAIEAQVNNPRAGRRRSR